MDHNSEYGVKQLLISDHLPVFVHNKKSHNTQHKTVFTRNLRGYTVDDFERIVRMDVRWYKFWFCNDKVNVLWNTIYSILLDALDQLCPVRERLIQEDRPEWNTGGVKIAIGEKNRLYGIAKSTNDKNDWDNFRKGKRDISKLIKQEKKKYI